ncbi:hypothetical protein [Faecalicoccus pleomorphus]|uniref:hypothetical protein n=1 Tax=Faecalicoccus pleomorphus TaxID=1323 RepID=UPI0019621C02|nr:hypothetical protein [Faecalicoccus pleomorphus]MBM6678077.1 hypothetical protein [Faecalicoccus pleomorphus]MDM8292613.1 hypothetical protein [Faecalicoccus pleomorphus]
MKKLLSLFVAMIFAIGMAGCGNNSDEQIQAASNVVTGYLDAIQSGDLDKAEDYTTDAYIDPLGIDNMDSYMESLLESLDMGETFDQEANDFAKNAVKAAITSYEINDTKMEEDTISVLVDIDGKDYENIDFTAMENELNTYTQNYANENLDRLMQIYTEQGEDAMMEAMMQDIGGYMFDEMETLFTGAAQKQYQMRFDLVQDEDEWKINGAEISEETQS